MLLEDWCKINKLAISESKISDSDIVSIDDVGKFLYLHSFDGNVIDEDFSFILSDEEFDLLDEGKVNYILFEFGGKYYYSPLKKDKNNYNEIIYKPEFNDFKYLGKSSEEHIADFVHLGVHDEYELMNGSSSCELWAKKAKFLGMKTLGVCDKNVLAETLSFQFACQKFGIKPIIGETVTVAINYKEDKELQETFDVKLYCLNEIGWKNLLLISKKINVDYDKFIPDYELYKLGKGLCIVIPKESEFNYYINDKEYVLNLIKKYKRSFEKVYYQIDTVEYVSNQLFKEHLSNIDKYICLYKDKVKPILINDSYYLDEEEHELKSYLNKDSGVVNPESENQYFKSLGDTLKSYDEWLDDTSALLNIILEGANNTVKLSECCNFAIDTSERKIPKFEVKDPEGLFFDLLEKGIQKKLVGKVDNMDEYMQRIQLECNLIVPNDLCSYFLILVDIINWSKNQGIMIGPGRGSACGSLVAYCLDITQIDPIPYHLYFERFLNASRVSAHNAYHLKMIDGKNITFRDGDYAPLVGGNGIYVDKDTNWNNLDIDINRIKK